MQAFIQDKQGEQLTKVNIKMTESTNKTATEKKSKGRNGENSSKIYRIKKLKNIAFNRLKHEER